jgi:hypothetical protein
MLQHINSFKLLSRAISILMHRMRTLIQNYHEWTSMTLIWLFLVLFGFMINIKPFIHFSLDFRLINNVFRTHISTNINKKWKLYVKNNRHLINKLKCGQRFVREYRPWGIMIWCHLWTILKEVIMIKYKLALFFIKPKLLTMRFLCEINIFWKALSFFFCQKNENFIQGT